MAGNQAGLSDKPVGRLLWQRIGLLPWSLATVLLLLGWIEIQARTMARPLRFEAIAILFLLHAILTLALERAFFYIPVRGNQRYRLAFLTSTMLPVAYWMIAWGVWAFTRWPSALAWSTLASLFVLLCIAFLGAFMGGMLATALSDGWYENNSPPSAQLQAEVHRSHQARLGVLRKVPTTKRSFDICLALLGSLLSTPVWLASAFLVWFENPGPVLFVKNSVGKGGRNFRQFKFRTMICGAEENTGPILSQKGDNRVLVIGGFLRKTALDELPQLINILTGEMSFVGPRPQRTVLVHGYLQYMPEYTERHRVLPGLSGLAQVAGDYYLSPRQKLRLDRIYIRYASLGFDLKLIFLACIITFWMRWRKGWNGRLPRSWLRLGSPKLEVKQ